MKTFPAALLVVVLVVPAAGTCPAAQGGGGTTVAGKGEVLSSFSEIMDGDRARYREDRQIRNGFYGGLSNLEIDADNHLWHWTSEARALNQMDMGIKSRLDRKNQFYIKQEATVFPRYYDGSNRFYNSEPRRYETDDELRTVRGDFSVELGTNMADAPGLYAGYRHQRRRGETNSYWGAWLRHVAPDDFILFLQPIARKRHDRSNTLYFGARDEWGGWLWNARQEIERFEGIDTYSEPGYYDNGSLIFTRLYRNRPRHTTWTTTTNAERDVLNDRGHVNFDYRFIEVSTNSITDVDSFTPLGTRHYGEHSLNYTVADHGGRSISHNAGGRFDYNPWDWARVWTGAKFVAGRAEGMSTRGEEGAEAAAVDNNDNSIDEYWHLQSVNREFGFTEELGLELNNIPKTRLAVEGTLDQNRAFYDWSGDVNGGANTGNDGDWMWVSTVWEQRNRMSLSVRNWAVPFMTMFGRYRYKVDGADVDDSVDIANIKPGDPEYDELNTDFFYPGRIEDWRRVTHEFLASPVFKFSPRWSINPRFEYGGSRYEVAGEWDKKISSYEARTWAVGVMGQPWDNVAWTFDVARKSALTWTKASAFSNNINTPNRGWYGGLTAPFDSSYTALNNEVQWTFHGLTLSTVGGLVKGNGDFATQEIHGGLSLKGALPKKLENVEWEVGYRISDYQEDENGGINDYTAHMIFLAARVPFEFSNRRAEK